MNRHTSSIKPLLLAASVTCALALSPLALAKGGSGHGPDLDQIAERLDLTAEQKSEFTSIMTASMDESRTRRESMKAERETEMNQLHNQLASVLTDEQLTQFESIMTKRHKKRNHHDQNEADGAE